MVIKKIYGSSDESPAKSTVYNYLKMLEKGLPAKRFRILRKIPLIKNIRLRPLFLKKAGDSILVYAPDNFLGKESAGILLWIAIIMLYAFTGYLSSDPQLITYASLFYFVLSAGVAIRILASYLYLRSNGIYRKWEIKVAVDGKTSVEGSFNGNITLKEIMEWALAKIYSSSVYRKPENYLIYFGNKQLSPQLRLCQTNLPTHLTFTLRRIKRTQS